MFKRMTNVLLVVFIVCAFNFKRPDEYFLDHFIAGMIFKHNDKEDLAYTFENYTQLKPYLDKCNWGYYISLRKYEDESVAKSGFVIRF